MSLKVKMLRGLPGSGKTTYAKELLKNDRSYGRVNRDELRETIFGGHWTPFNEKIIIECEKAIARVLLNHDRHIIVDDTNLGKKHEDLWKDFVSKEVADKDGIIDFVLEDLSIPIEECIRRDAIRGIQGKPSVGRNVIVKMALRNKLLPFPDKPIVIVDVDGTIADGSHREYLVKGEKKRWKEYFELLEGDLPIVPIFKWVNELSKENTILMVSGRDGAYAERTIAWFNRVTESCPMFPEQEIPRYPVFEWIFRDKDDHRPDNEVKLEVLKYLPVKPWLVLDDRPVVCRMRAKEGLKVIPVRGACDEF